MRKFKNMLFFTLLLPLFTIILSAGSGGGGKNDPPACSVTTQNVNVVLSDFFQYENGRLQPPPLSPNPFNTFYWSSTWGTSLNDSPWDKYYCFIEVEAIGCSYFKTYTWNVDGNSKSIPVPNNYSFKVTATYYEKCSDIFGDGNSKRTKYKNSVTCNTGTPPYVLIPFSGNWNNLGTISCN